MKLSLEALWLLWLCLFLSSVCQALPPGASSCVGYPYQWSLVVVRSINGLEVEAHSIIGPPPGSASPCSFWTKAIITNPGGNRVHVDEQCPYTGGDLCTLQGPVIAVAHIPLNNEAGTYRGDGDYAVFNDTFYPGNWTFPPDRSDTLASSCGNTDKDMLLLEYTDGPYQPSQPPVCGDFVKDVSTANFSYAELNSGYYQHAILKGTLLGGVECVRAQNVGETTSVNSGFRNPSRNAVVSPGTINSRHVYGDAGDFHAPFPSQIRTNSFAIKLACGACREPLDQEPRVHFDWRGGCPVGW